MIIKAPNPHEDLAGFEKATAEAKKRVAFAQEQRLHYPFEPPFLFDCRLRRDGRRMGIGDQIVLIGVLQAISRQVGWHAVRILYDPDYPSAEALWTASQLYATPVPGDMPIPEAGWREWTRINLRHHFLEDPLGHTNVCAYGEKQGYPGDQLLYNLGWHDQVQCRPVSIHLEPGPLCRRQAASWLSGMGGWFHCPPFVVTANYLELTRGNQHTDPERWKAVLADLQEQARAKGRKAVFVWGMAAHEKTVSALKAIYALSPEPLEVVTPSLMTWLAIISMADHHVTGNTSGMWLGFSTTTPMTIISKSDTEHGGMWEPKPHWFTPERRASVHH